MTQCLEREWSLQRAGSLPILKQEHPDSEPHQGAKQPARSGDFATIASQEKKSGDIKHEGNTGLHNSCDRETEIPELPKLEGDANRFLYIICYKNTAQRKAWEEALAPRQEGGGHSVCSITWGWQQGGDAQPAGCGPSMW